MDQRQKSRVELLTRVALLTVTGVSLSACQKARMSTVQRPIATPNQVSPVRPIPQPGIPVGPGGPGSIVPPINRPPVVVTPPPVQPGGPVTTDPDDTTPPSSTPPATEVIVSVPPAIPATPPPPTTVYTPPTPAPTPAPAQPTPTTPVTSTPGTTVVQIPQTSLPPNGGVITTPVPPRGGTVSTGGTRPLTPTPLPIPSGTVRVDAPTSPRAIPTCEGVSCVGSKPTVETTGSTVQAPVITLRPRQLDKVDILFVVDTSASMKAERKAIMSQLKEFTRHFDDEVDYSVSILLGHGPRSNAAIEKLGINIQTGSLYMGQFSGTQSRVQSSQLVERAKLHMLEKQAGTSLSKEDLVRLARAQAAEEIGQRLADAIDQAPNDKTDAQGEAGLLNLYTALTKNRGQLEKDGTLRRGAGLVVFFIADENDICFDYAKAQKQGRNLKGNYATAQDKAAETRAFNDSETCARVVNNSQRLTEEAVLNALKAAKGSDPVIVSGVLYLDEKSVTQARKANDRFKGDNETGHGYLDLIALAHGEAADLSGANFGKKMYELGKLSDFKLKYDTVFQIQGIRDTNNIDENSVRVTIVNEQGRSQALRPQDVKLEVLNERNAQVVVDARALEKVVAGGKLSGEHKVFITYSERSSESSQVDNQQAQKAAQSADQTAAPIEASRPSTVNSDKNPYEIEFNH